MLKISDGTDDFSLLAIPFFVLAAAIVAEGGMATRLVDLAKVFIGFIHGGLALVNILASTLFGCISGSSVADTTSIGSVMIREWFRPATTVFAATSMTICGCGAGADDPALAQRGDLLRSPAGGTVSIAHLFLAGVFPGLLFGCAWWAWCCGYSRGATARVPSPCRWRGSGASWSMRCGGW